MPRPEQVDIVSRLMSAAIAVDDMQSVDLEALWAEAARVIQTLRSAVPTRETETATRH